MFRTKNKQDLCKRFPDWIVSENKTTCTVKNDSPLYWILKEKQNIGYVNSHSGDKNGRCFNKNHIKYNTIDHDLAEYYQMREQQFRRDNDRIRMENDRLVRKLAREDVELQRTKKELEITREKLELTNRQKWKQLFESVLREIVIGKRYQQDIEQMRSAYEKEMENRRGFMARILGK